MLLDVDAPYLWIHGERVEPDPDDGSVQLRLDGIDAPEALRSRLYHLYDSTPPAVRMAFTDLGRTARDAALGVCAGDSRPREVRAVMSAARFTVGCARGR